MASPGWYPDPAGQPGAFRFWDGGAWSAELSDTPYAPAPGQAPAPPPPPPGPPADAFGYQSYAGAPTQSDWGPTPGAPSQPQQFPPAPPAASSSGRGWVVALVALVAAIALGVATFFVVEALTDDGSSTSDSSASGPDERATDPAPTSPPTDQPSDQPSADPSAGTSDGASDGPSEPPETVDPAGLQCTGGLPTQGATGVQGRFVTGGGLRMPRAKGFTTRADGDRGGVFVFADGVTAPSKVIEQVGSTGWVALYALGGLPRANGFDSPQQAAETVLGCMTSSKAFYRGYTGTDVLDAGATTVGGADAWEITADVNIDDPELTVTGDVAKVIVVDTGDPDLYGLFVSVVPIGDDELIAQQTDQAAKLRLE